MDNVIDLDKERARRGKWRGLTQHEIAIAGYQAKQAREEFRPAMLFNGWDREDLS